MSKGGFERFEHCLLVSGIIEIGREKDCLEHRMSVSNRPGLPVGIPFGSLQVRFVLAQIGLELVEQHFRH